MLLLPPPSQLLPLSQLLSQSATCFSFQHSFLHIGDYTPHSGLQSQHQFFRLNQSLGRAILVHSSGTNLASYSWTLFIKRNSPWSHPICSRTNHLLLYSLNDSTPFSDHATRRKKSQFDSLPRITCPWIQSVRVDFLSSRELPRFTLKGMSLTPSKSYIPFHSHSSQRATKQSRAIRENPWFNGTFSSEVPKLMRAGVHFISFDSDKGYQTCLFGSSLLKTYKDSLHSFFRNTTETFSNFPYKLSSEAERILSLNSYWRVAEALKVQKVIKDSVRFSPHWLALRVIDSFMASRKITLLLSQVSISGTTLLSEFNHIMIFYGSSPFQRILWDLLCE